MVRKLSPNHAEDCERVKKTTKILCGAMAAVIVIMLVISGEEYVSADSLVEMKTETKYVALTFDDGPREGTTDRLLDGLKERGANATFFLVGEQAAVAQELVRRMKDEGHQVGNHTWSHVRLEGTDETELLREIDQNERLLEEILGGENYWLRPPYGVISPDILARIQVPLVKWSVDPRDWESRDQKKIVEAVLEAVEPNSIILLHDIYPTSVDAALELIDTLQKEGYWFVTVEELLRLNGITPRAGAFYRSGE